MTCRVWSIDDEETASADDDDDHHQNPATTTGRKVGMIGREIGRMEAHTEFVTGADWCLFGAEGWCATCSWDERVLVWDVAAFCS